MSPENGPGLTFNRKLAPSSAVGAPSKRAGLLAELFLQAAAYQLAHLPWQQEEEPPERDQCSTEEEYA